jgi:5-methylcytosine-specific restriction endonuclease McrA
VPTVQKIQDYHLWLKDFGKHYRKKGNKELASKPFKVTLRRLKHLGTLKCVYKNPRPLETKRKAFDSKVQKSRYLRFGKCFLCYQDAYLVRHHIVWLSNGGGNEKSNVVTLCEYCHAEIHPWLKSKLKKKEDKTEEVQLIPSTSYSPLFDKLFI